jgi:hypothetical protein
MSSYRRSYRSLRVQCFRPDNDKADTGKRTSRTQWAVGNFINENCLSLFVFPIRDWDFSNRSADPGLVCHFNRLGRPYANPLERVSSYRMYVEVALQRAL